MAKPWERPPNIYQKIAIDNEIDLLSYLHYSLLKKIEKKYFSRFMESQKRINPLIRDIQKCISKQLDLQSYYPQCKIADIDYWIMYISDSMMDM